MFYRFFRAIVTLLLRLFYRVAEPVDPLGGLSAEGPVIYVGNHPNGLVDPGLLFILVKRHVTFLAKAPLFKIPVLGLILRGMDALPVFRKQDGAATTQNEGTLTASVEALVAGRAITLFPEGKSHSEPQLAELKTGCARIAIEAAKRGAKVKVIPVGLDYAQKRFFRSKVAVSVGEPLDAAKYGEADARKFTDDIADALRRVTLNLEQWDDQPILETAEALYSLKIGEAPRDPERQRRFARGIRLLREEQPERFEALKEELLAFRRRLSMLDTNAKRLFQNDTPFSVTWFVLRNVLWLLLLPFALVGFVLFFIPYWVPLLMVRATKPEPDTEATIKVLTLLLLAPLWWALLIGIGAAYFGWQGALVALLGTLPIALFTRMFIERRSQAVRNARAFLLLTSRASLKARLVEEGDALAAQVEQVANELRERVVA